MLGMILALFYAASMYVVSHATTGVTYLQSTHFLYEWYLVWTVILAVAMFVITLVIVLGGGVVGADGYRSGLYGRRLNMIGMFLGVAGGGAISLLLWVVFIVKRGLYVVGAYLLSTALVIHGVAGEAIYVWDSVHLVIGGLLLLIALATSRFNYLSHSSSD
jgi:hypothetical protein